ncbi:hypothetical protein, variant [Blastomyces dermatitidis ER-3]|uniref:Rhodopsin domain-containing protein n=1 Tax=Ajellomyces dermatitidis (strain ER-3 / ATCC MYA-2586) TaxID=559297 RepID=A0ABP2ELS0_AJEDR|nr:uncharacterized protein BDCG_00985 [Blastomyces dermatitidis ER-3]XP_045279388.1 hypothetical protein, variant [Blastomyces dermatitidis ER-3]EEQ84180.1 hypothetical protein BDCG_00985 [Blastomyces dermatitidis ER-3]OAS99660.1 hypothetical protein, variant [Blastomyces dermatitidis ER-3]
MYSSNAPDELTRWDVIPTLLVSWWCTGFSLAIIFVRILGRYIRTQVLFPEDWVMLISVIPLLIRMGLVHLVLLYGTNNMIAANISDIQLRRREIGSGLVLGARIFYALFIWTAKYTIAEFLTRLTAQTWRRSFQLMLNFIRFFLVVTFAAVVISTLAECQPFQDYWQVSPMPAPECRQGYAHLVAMGACDAATDILLVAFPIPIIFASTMPTRRKLSLTILFSLSLILVVMTCYRVPAVIERHGNQQYRSLFASLEVLVATAISNAIVIGSFMRDRGVKKQKYQIGSVSEASDQKFSRSATITTHQWGSDADLATDVGIRLDTEAEMPTYQEIRPAPLAHANNGYPEKNSLSGSRVAPCHRLERDEDVITDRDSQKPFPFDQPGSVPNTPEATASDTISTVTPEPPPKDCLYGMGGWEGFLQACKRHQLQLLLVQQMPLPLSHLPNQDSRDHNLVVEAANSLTQSLIYYHYPQIILDLPPDLPLDPPLAQASMTSIENPDLLGHHVKMKTVSILAPWGRGDSNLTTRLGKLAKSGKRIRKYKI